MQAPFKLCGTEARAYIVAFLLKVATAQAKCLLVGVADTVSFKPAIDVIALLGPFMYPEFDHWTAQSIAIHFDVIFLG